MKPFPLNIALIDPPHPATSLRLDALCNEAGAAAGLVGLGNDLPEAGSPGTLFMPYGDYLHDTGLERFDAESGKALCNSFDALKRKMGADWPGLPVYIGHPDVPDLAAKFPDKSSYAWVTGLSNTAAGVTAATDWNADGQELVRKKKFCWFSPYFGGEKIGMANSITIYRPVELRSIGVTNRPNIHKFRLPNEAGTVQSTVQPGEMKMDLLKRLLALLGLPDTTTEDDAVSTVQKMFDAARKIRDAMQARWAAESAAGSALPALCNEAGDDERLGALLTALVEGRQTHLDKVLGLENEKRTAGEQLTALQALLAASKARVAELEGQHTALVNEKHAERTARIGILLDQAVKEGRIAPAKRAEWETALGADFAGKSVALANERGALKTTAQTGDLGQRSSAAQDNVTKIVGLVNEEMKKTNGDYDRAYANVKKANPVLFGLGTK